MNGKQKFPLGVERARHGTSLQPAAAYPAPCRGSHVASPPESCESRISNPMDGKQKFPLGVERARHGTPLQPAATYPISRRSHRRGSHVASPPESSGNVPGLRRGSHVASPSESIDNAASFRRAPLIGELSAKLTERLNQERAARQSPAVTYPIPRRGSHVASPPESNIFYIIMSTRRSI